MATEKTKGLPGNVKMGRDEFTLKAPQTIRTVEPSEDHATVAAYWWTNTVFTNANAGHMSFGEATVGVITIPVLVNKKALHTHDVLAIYTEKPPPVASLRDHVMSKRPPPNAMRDGPDKAARVSKMGDNK